MFDPCFVMQYKVSFLDMQSSRISEVSRKLKPREISERIIDGLGLIRLFF